MQKLHKARNTFFENSEEKSEMMNDLDSFQQEQNLIFLKFVWFKCYFQYLPEVFC